TICYRDGRCRVPFCCASPLLHCSLSLPWNPSCLKLRMAEIGIAACLCLMLAMAAGGALGSSPCDDPSVANLPFCNPDLDLVDRVKDLVSRMSVTDMISQLGNTAPAIEHLNIPAYQWWSEALHGVASSPGVSFGGKVPSATSFPQVIGIAATFNSTLFYEMGQAISTEARAMNNVGQAGLTFFTPNINIYRDPRWGRGQETPGEDPYLTSAYVEQYVAGLQFGPDQRYLKTVACCKHFSAYDLENWNGTDRFHFNAIVSDQDFAETYFPAFESCVRVGKVSSIMCSYNAVNGVPSCANNVIQNQIVRNEWDFSGFIVSDCGAINTIMADHHYTNTTEETVQVALRAGTNLNCGGFYQKYAMEAYNKSYITEADLANAVGPLFGQRMALGMFDPTHLQPYLNISTDQINSPAHQALALDAARESIVLLQNDGSLPLSAESSLKVAVIGPNSNATETMQGNYHGVAPYLISPLMGIQDAGVTSSWAFGCDVACSDSGGFAEAVTIAKGADVVIVVMGLDHGQEREGHDRNVITLPGMQLDLMQEVREAIGGRPLVLVLMSGGPVDISWAKSNANAILWTGYPGQSGGKAIADVIFGKFNPSGRLPVTYYPGDYVNQISFFNMSMRDPPGRTYKFYTGTPVFEFGHGLSYISFSRVCLGVSFGRLY
ncbi:Probable beta-D-xylosidase 2, partial [Geodia barretti]